MENELGVWKMTNYEGISDSMDYGLFRCGICGKVFGTGKGLQVHESFHKKGIIDDSGKYTREFSRKLEKPRR